jgi:hypothetical protein
MPAAVRRIRPVRTLITPEWSGGPVGTSWRFQYSSGTPAVGSTTSPPTRQAVEVSFICAKSSRGMWHGTGISKKPAKFESKLALVTNSASRLFLSLANSLEWKGTLPS